MVPNLPFVPDNPSVMFDPQFSENFIFIKHSCFTPLFIVKLFHNFLNYFFNNLNFLNYFLLFINFFVNFFQFIC